MTNETMKNVESEIKNMVESIGDLDNRDIAYHHKVEYKIKRIEQALGSINYYRDQEVLNYGR